MPTGAVAWYAVQTEVAPRRELLRSALVFAAEQCADDPDWLVESRWLVVWSLIDPLVIDPRQRFDDLVEACRSRFGPRISTALSTMLDVRR